MATTVSINYELKPLKGKSKVQIYLRMTSMYKDAEGKRHAEHKRIATDVYISDRHTIDEKGRAIYTDWNYIKEEVRRSGDDYAIKNAKLRIARNEVEETALELKRKGSATPKAIKATIKAVPTSSSFIDFAKDVEAAERQAGHIYNARKYARFILYLEQYQKCVSFDDIDAAFVYGFERYLRTLKNTRIKEKEQMLHPNTVARHLIQMRAVINRAISRGIMEKNPFDTYEIRNVQTIKEKLDEAEINALEALDLKEGTLIWHTRNYFLFAFYVGGMRWGDVCWLRWGNIYEATATDGQPQQRLCYQMGKNQKTRDIILVPQVQKILDYYRGKQHKPTDFVFPLLDSKKSWAKAVTMEEREVLTPEEKEDIANYIGACNAKINKYLKKLQSMAEIGKSISTHISRHSFARRAKVKGVDNVVLKGIMAHSNIATTDRYIGNFDTASQDEAMQTIFSPSQPAKPNADALVQQLQSLDAATLQTILSRLNA